LLMFRENLRNPRSNFYFPMQKVLRHGKYLILRSYPVHAVARGHAGGHTL